MYIGGAALLVAAVFTYTQLTGNQVEQLTMEEVQEQPKRAKIIRPAGAPAAGQASQIKVVPEEIPDIAPDGNKYDDKQKAEIQKFAEFRAKLRENFVKALDD